MQLGTEATRCAMSEVQEQTPFSQHARHIQEQRSRQARYSYPHASPKGLYMRTHNSIAAAQKTYSPSVNIHGHSISLPPSKESQNRGTTGVPPAHSRDAAHCKAERLPTAAEKSPPVARACHLAAPSRRVALPGACVASIFSRRLARCTLPANLPREAMSTAATCPACTIKCAASVCGVDGAELNDRCCAGAAEAWTSHAYWPARLQGYWSLPQHAVTVAWG